MIVKSTKMQHVLHLLTKITHLHRTISVNVELRDKGYRYKQQLTHNKKHCT